MSAPATISSYDACSNDDLPSSDVSSSDDLPPPTSPPMTISSGFLLESGKALVSLINQVLDLAKIEAEEMDWDNNGQVTIREFLFGFIKWVGIDADE
ncbi:hypothetical protein Ahy_B04g071257 isoform A [Arachis hypogaea]|uniref:EF-hand domain-containing protein n=1 Tax=Arachis hypogaea TaxID=3818 RepID=A0A444ZKD3_ARAHY|nr:hypothetical protein Ahy_B04g071257 isoform A [Arachis hypogaea]